MYGGLIGLTCSGLARHLSLRQAGSASLQQTSSATSCLSMGQGAQILCVIATWAAVVGLVAPEAAVVHFYDLEVRSSLKVK